MGKSFILDIRDIQTEEVARQYKLSMGPALVYRWLLEPKYRLFSNWGRFAQLYKVNVKTVWRWRKILIKKGLIPEVDYEIKAK